MVRNIRTRQIISNGGVRLVAILDHECVQDKLSWSVCHPPTHWWEILLGLVCQGPSSLNFCLIFLLEFLFPAVKIQVVQRTANRLNFT